MDVNKSLRQRMERHLFKNCKFDWLTHFLRAKLARIKARQTEQDLPCERAGFKNDVLHLVTSIIRREFRKESDHLYSILSDYTLSDLLSRRCLLLLMVAFLPGHSQPHFFLSRIFKRVLLGSRKLRDFNTLLRWITRDAFCVWEKLNRFFIDFKRSLISVYGIGSYSLS